MIFRPSCFKTVLGPLLGPFWGPLGGAFWLTSRLKIGQEPPRPVLEYFFSAPGPSLGPFGRSSAPFRGPPKNRGARDPPRRAQKAPPGGARRAPNGPHGAPKLARKKPRENKTNGSEKPREATQEKLNKPCFLCARLGYASNFGSGTTLRFASQALRL